MSFCHIEPFLPKRQRGAEEITSIDSDVVLHLWWIMGVQMYRLTLHPGPHDIVCCFCCRVRLKKARHWVVASWGPTDDRHLKKMAHLLCRPLKERKKQLNHQLRLVVYPIIDMILYIPGGCLGFLPSTISEGLHFCL